MLPPQDSCLWGKKPHQALVLTILLHDCFRGLDFDRNPGHFYKVTVYATDKGAPPKSSSVNVRVTVTNINDESPEFTSSKLEIDVDENAPIGTVIAIIQAIDLDGDAVTYYFTRKLLVQMSVLWKQIFPPPRCVVSYCAG